MMAEMKISQQSNAAIYSKTKEGTITQSDDYEIKRKTSHDEIAIMESDWDYLKKKINRITISKGLNIPNILIGVVIPYAISVIDSIVKNEQANYLPLVVSLVLFIITYFVSLKLKVIGDGNSNDNRIHLEDLKEKINEIDNH